MLSVAPVSFDWKTISPTGKERSKSAIKKVKIYDRKKKIKNHDEKKQSVLRTTACFAYCSRGISKSYNKQSSDEDLQNVCHAQSHYVRM